MLRVHKYYLTFFVLGSLPCHILSPVVRVQVLDSVMSERDKAGIVLIAVFIPCIIIGMIMCFCCHRGSRSSRSSRSSRPSRPSRPPPRSYNYTWPGQDGRGYHAPSYSQRTAPWSIPMPAHIAPTHPPPAPQSQTHSTTFAEGAALEAELPTDVQEQLLQQNGAMGQLKWPANSWPRANVRGYRTGRGPRSLQD